MVSSLAMYLYYQITYFIFLLEPICRTVLLTVYLRARFIFGIVTAVSVFVLPALVLVFSSTLLRLDCANFLLAFGFAMCGVWVSQSVETVLCTPYISITRKWALIAIMWNGQWLRGINLLYAAIAMLSVVPDFGSKKKGSVNENKAAWTSGRCFTSTTIVIQFSLLLRFLQMDVCPGTSVSDLVF